MQSSLFPQIEIESQADVIEALRPRLQMLRAVVAETWDNFLARRDDDYCFNRMTESEAAEWITTQAAHMADDQFRGRPEYRILQPHGKRVFVVDDTYAFTIKKLKRRTRARGGDITTWSSYSTRRQIEFWRQARKQELPNMPRLILGYFLQREMRGIDIVIACPRLHSRRVDWSYPIPYESPQIRPVLVPATADEDGGSSDGYIITPAVDAKDGEIRRNA